MPFEIVYKCEPVLSVTDETLASQPDSRSAGVLTEARPASALMSLLKNPELPPISVEPNIGTIEPGAVQNFSIRFSPQEVGQFQGKLFCRYRKLFFKINMFKNKELAKLYYSEEVNVL